MNNFAKISSSIGVDEYHEKKTAEIRIGDEVIIEITQENGIENAEIDFWTAKNDFSSPVCSVKFDDLRKILDSEYERLLMLSAP